jgi:hypothetical protein
MAKILLYEYPGFKNMDDVGKHVKAGVTKTSLKR